MSIADVPEQLSPRDLAMPLAGVVVTESGAGLAVAFCGRLLADYGATVVKVDKPAEGQNDGGRQASPRPRSGPESKPALHAFLNAGKLSVTLEESRQLDRSLLEKLLDASDIAVRFGNRLSPRPTNERGSATAPGRVEVNISWLGQSGPWSAFACDDFLAQHVSGMAFTSALRVDETSESPPRAAPGHLAEMVAGLTAANASVVGLAQRDRAGSSPQIEIAVAEALASFMRSETVTYSYGAGLVSRSKLARSPIAAPVFQQATADGFVDLLLMQEAPWRALLEILGNPSWGDEEIFATHPLRSEYWDALEPLLQAEMSGVTTKRVYEEGQARGIAIAPVNSVAQAAQATQFAERGFFADQPTNSGLVRVPGPPFRIAEVQRPRGVVPSRGEHTVSVFRDWLGCTAAEIAHLTRPETV